MSDLAKRIGQKIGQMIFDTGDYLLGDRQDDQMEEIIDAQLAPLVKAAQSLVDLYGDAQTGIRYGWQLDQAVENLAAKLREVDDE